MSIEHAVAIPFNQKDELKKKYSIIWNKEHKMWCAPTQAHYNGMVKYHVVKVTVLFQNNERFKELGGQWNGKYHYVQKSLYNKYTNEFEALQTEGELEFSDEDS
jgi:hypothetical protein